MFSPLKPTVTYGQEDPVYWRLHRFLHWEEVRQSIPRRRSGFDGYEGDDLDKEEAYLKALRKSNNERRKTVAVAERAPLNSRISRPVPKERPKQVRDYYANLFDLPSWMDEDLVRRPSPTKDAVHPWDVDHPDGNEEEQPTTSNQAQPEGVKPHLEGEGAEKPAEHHHEHHAPETTHHDHHNGQGHHAIPPIVKSEGEPDLKPILRNRAETENKKMLESKKPHHVQHAENNRPSSAVRSSDANAQDVLATLRSRRMSRQVDESNDAKTSNVKQVKEEVNKTIKHAPSSSEPPSKSAPKNAGSGDPTITPTANKQQSVRRSKSEEQEAPKKKMTTRERVKAEMKSMRNPPKKKAYVPQSQRMIKPPKERETWDHIGAKIGGRFRENSGWQPAGKQTLDGDDSDEGNLTRRSTKVSFRDRDPSSRLEPMNDGLSRQNSLNKLRILPPIVNDNGQQTREIGLQAGINEIAINTDVETRAIGISTRDDVVYIYETVEVKKKRKKKGRRNKDNKSSKSHKSKRNHRQHKRKSRHQSSDEEISSSESSTSSNESYKKRRRDQKGEKKILSKKRRDSSSSSGSSSSSSGTSRSQSGTSDDNLSDSETSFKATPPKKSKKHRAKDANKREKKRKDKKAAPGDDEVADKQERVVEFKVRSWSGRTRRMSFMGEDLEKNTIEGLRNKILKEVGIPKESVEMTVGTPSRSRQGQRRLTVADIKQKTLEKLKRRVSLVPTAAAGNQSSGTGTESNSPRGVSSRRSSNSQNQASRPSGGQHVPLQAQHSTARKSPSLSQVIDADEDADEQQEQQESSVPSSRQKVSSRQQSSREGASSEPQVYQQQVPQQVLHPCRYCSRRFLADRLEVHEATCVKTNSSTRKVFDSKKARLASILSNTNDRYLLESNNSGSQKAPKAKPSMWRERHKAFLEQIRYAKKVTEVEKAGGDVRSLGPAPTTFTADLEQCQKCGRKFNSEALKRHAPICKAVPVKK